MLERLTQRRGGFEPLPDVNPQTFFDRQYLVKVQHEHVFRSFQQVTL